MFSSESTLSDFELPLPPAMNHVGPASISSGPTPTPKQQLIAMNDESWEEFICEWGVAKRKDAIAVIRIGGANDRGADVAILHEDSLFAGKWECCQCKFYAQPITSHDARVEIAKMIWNIWRGKITKPIRYWFFAPKDCNSTLKRLLANPSELRDDVLSKWTNAVAKKISSSEQPKLEGELKTFAEAFDFSIFREKSTDTVISEHAQSGYAAYRFYTVNPARPEPEEPPAQPTIVEANYIGKLTHVYAEHREQKINNYDLKKDREMREHLHRQRQHFYHAESLGSFARDNHPPNTFEKVQDEILIGIEDVVKYEVHKNGFAKLTAVLKEAGRLPAGAGLLKDVIRVQDKRGVCHQLANDDRLTWDK